MRGRPGPLRFWEAFGLVRILTDLLEPCESLELLGVDLLPALLRLRGGTICHSCEQSTSTWESTALVWVKVNSEVGAAQLCMIGGWLGAS